MKKNENKTLIPTYKKNKTKTKQKTTTTLLQAMVAIFDSEQGEERRAQQRGMVGFGSDAVPTAAAAYGAQASASSSHGSPLLVTMQNEDRVIIWNVENVENGLEHAILTSVSLADFVDFKVRQVRMNDSERRQVTKGSMLNHPIKEDLDYEIRVRVLPVHGAGTHAAVDLFPFRSAGRAGPPSSLRGDPLRYFAHAPDDFGFFGFFGAAVAILGRLLAITTPCGGVLLYLLPCTRIGAVEALGEVDTAYGNHTTAPRSKLFTLSPGAGYRATQDPRPMQHPGSLCAQGAGRQSVLRRVVRARSAGAALAPG